MAEIAAKKLYVGTDLVFEKQQAPIWFYGKTPTVTTEDYKYRNQINNISTGEPLGTQSLITIIVTNERGHFFERSSAFLFQNSAILGSSVSVSFQLSISSAHVNLTFDKATNVLDFNITSGSVKLYSYTILIQDF